MGVREEERERERVKVKSALIFECVREFERVCERETERNDVMF